MNVAQYMIPLATAFACVYFAVKALVWAGSVVTEYLDWLEDK